VGSLAPLRNFDDRDATGWLALRGDWGIVNDPSAPTRPSIFRSAGAPVRGGVSHVIVDWLTFSDADVRVRCRAPHAEARAVCGLTFRVSDSEHFYAARADERARQLVLYRVAGAWQPLANARLPAFGNRWHSLKVRTDGTEYIVRWDRKALVTVRDDLLPRAGAIGLLADATVAATDYDDLEATAR
jgi:hypothetical protein